MIGTTATVKVEETSSVTRKLEFDVPWPEVKKEMDIAYAKLAKKSKIKGFRPGKAPRQVLEAYYKEQAEEETIYNLINRLYFDSLKENGIHALAQPRIDQKGITADNNFTFTASVEVAPVVDPQGYKDLVITKVVREVKPEDVESVLQKLRRSFATFQELTEDRGIAKEDYVTLDFQGYFDGEKQDDLKGIDAVILLNGSTTLPDFEDQLMNLKKGEEKEFKITYPSDYHEEKYAGREASFLVNIKDIQKQILPDIDKNFIKNFEKYSSLEELTDNIRKSLEAQYQEEANEKFKNDVIENLFKQNEFDAPPSLIESETYSLMEEHSRMLMSHGIPREQAAERAYQLYNSLKPEAVKRVKAMYLLQRIAAKESITIEVAEIDEAIKAMASVRGEDFEELKKKFIENNMLEVMAGQLLEKKVFKYIEDTALMAAAGEASRGGDN